MAICFGVLVEQETIALWTGVEGYSSLYDGEGTTGMGMVYTIAIGLSIPERKC